MTMSDPTRRAAAITRALRDLTTGRLATETVKRPCTAAGGFRVTTTTLLARQLNDDPNGHTLVKRRVAAALHWDLQRIGVYINPDRAIIDIVLTGSPSHLNPTTNKAAVTPPDRRAAIRAAP